MTDTGIGIPEDRLVCIFDEFVQADNSTTRRYGGTGLGLSIARQTIELMQGELTVSSKVGEGTKFKVAIGFEVSSGPAGKAVADEISLLDKLRILLVEDEPGRVFLVAHHEKIHAQRSHDHQRRGHERQSEP